MKYQCGSPDRKYERLGEEETSSRNQKEPKGLALLIQSFQGMISSKGSV